MSFFSKARGALAVAAAALLGSRNYKPVDHGVAKFSDLPDPVLRERPVMNFGRRGKKTSPPRGRTHTRNGARLSVKYPANGHTP